MQQINEKSVHVLREIYEKYNQRPVASMTIGDGDSRFSFEVKRRLSADEMARVVHRVCSGVFDSKTGGYCPEWKDYFLRIAVLETYTNIRLPDDNECWDLVYGTPIFAMITGHENRPVTFDTFEYDCNQAIDVEQYEQLLSAIDQRIDYAIKRSMMTGIVRGLAAASNSVRSDSIERGGRFYAS